MPAVFRVLSQPWSSDRVGDELLNAINDADFGRISARVSFVKASGVRYVASALEAARARGVAVRIIVGVDGSVTSAAGVRALYNRVDELYLLRDPGHLFHPKTWLFEASGDGLLLIGSPNLTESALWTNYEDLAILGLENPDHVAEVIKQFDDAAAAQNCQLATTELIDQLAEAGLLVDESSQRRESHKRDKDDDERAAEAGIDDLFPRKTVPPPPPTARLPEEVAEAPPSVPPADAGEEPPPAPPTSAGKEPPIPAPPATGEASQYRAFLLRLGKRDVGTQPGFSPDIFIPLAAYRHEPKFWGNLVTTETAGAHVNQERRIAVAFHRTTGAVEIKDRRLYLYETKSEFRLNSREIHADAKEGDLLRIELSNEPGHEYSARVIRPTDSTYAENDAIAANAVANSNKRWGYR
jgi:HKD family nuclease